MMGIAVGVILIAAFVTGLIVGWVWLSVFAGMGLFFYGRGFYRAYRRDRDQLASLWNKRAPRR
jgi:hypothetical protein